MDAIVLELDGGAHDPARAPIDWRQARELPVVKVAKDLGQDVVVEEVPARVDVPYDTDNSAQRTGFICIRPYTVTMTTN